MKTKTGDYLSNIITNYHPIRVEMIMAMVKSLKENPRKQLGMFLSVIKDRRLILLAIITTLIYAPIYYYRIHFPVDSDFSSHMLFTRYLIHGNFDHIPAHILAHPGLQISIAGLYFLSLHKISLGILLTGILTASQVLTALTIYIWLGSALKRRWDTGRAILAGTLTLVAPVMLLVFRDKLFYFGYIALANYHNPTIILLRPFALISFLLGVRAFTGINNSWKLIHVSGILIVISAFIKPNYLLCILPALFILTVWWKVQHKVVDYRYLVFGFLLPSILVLGVQWWIAYRSPDSDASHIIFSLAGVESAYSRYLLPKFLLSILFPLSVLVCKYKKYKDNPDLLLGLIGFIVGAFQVYFLAESGNRFYDGNFRWGAQVMLFLWFVVSTKELLYRLFDGNKFHLKKVVLSGIYLSHLAAGIAYYVYCFLSTTYA
jgi:hypothetical protein